MSDLTQCNFCGLRRIKEQAVEEGWVITLVPSKYELGGLEVYMHPRDINIHLLRAPTRRKYWRCWMWAIGSHCEC